MKLRSLNRMELPRKTLQQRFICTKNFRLSLVFFSLFWFTSAFASSDLQITGSEVHILSDSQTLELKVSISNLGPSDASNVRIRIHLNSSSANPAEQEMELQPLPLNASRTERIQLASSDSEFGTIDVELFDLIEPDTRPLNNSISLKYQMPGIQTADLQILDVAILSEQPVTERFVKFQIRMKNTGPSTVRNSTLSADLAQFQKTLSYQEKKIGKMEPDDEKELRLVLPIPVEGIPVQETLLKILIMPADPIIRDVDERNNVYQVPVLLGVRVADLVLSGLRVDSRGSLTFSILNKGTAPAKDSVTALYVNGALMRRYRTPSLAPGKDRRHQFAGAKIVSGTKLSIVLDFNADVPELSEENNRLEYNH